MTGTVIAADALDTRLAARGARRVPESTRHVLDGWPGGLLAQRTVRHTTRTASFQVVLWITVLIDVAAVVVLARVLALVVR